MVREAQQEVTSLGQDASKGLSDLRATIVNRTRGLSLTGNLGGTAPTATDGDEDKQATPTTAKELSHDEAMQESETVLSRLRGEAAKRLKDLQKAEDAADEALVKFGANIRDFLRDAISIAPPSGGRDGRDAGTVLFESKDAQGKRVIHTSRFEAQLHVIHTNPDSFAKDPSGDEYTAWSGGFDIDHKTADVATDLAKYPELRTTMEKLVPDTIPYADFWKRYYFLRHGIETAEARRRDLLKGTYIYMRQRASIMSLTSSAASAEEEVGWDEDSEDEAAGPSRSTKPERPGSTESSTTIHPPRAATLLKTSSSPRTSDEKSQPDSEASYDMVGAKSGVPSQAPSSPKESGKGGESDDDDWE